MKAWHKMARLSHFSTEVMIKLKPNLFIYISKKKKKREKNTMKLGLFKIILKAPLANTLRFSNTPTLSGL